MNNREKILQYTIDKIQRGKVSELSFRTIANEIGVKSSSVHYYFPKKDDLILQALNSYREICVEYFQAINAKFPEPRSRIRALADFFLASKKEEKMCLGGMLSSIYEENDEQTQKGIDVFFTVFHNWVEENIHLAYQKSKLKIGLSPRQAARVIICSLEGALLLDRNKKSANHIKVCKELIDEILD